MCIDLKITYKYTTDSKSRRKSYIDPADGAVVFDGSAGTVFAVVFEQRILRGNAKKGEYVFWRFH